MLPPAPDAAAALKSALRRDVRLRIASLTPERLAAESERVFDRVAASQPFLKARTVLLYAAMPTEVDLDAVAPFAWSLHKRVALPLVDWSTKSMTAVEVPRGRWMDLIPGPKGIRQPPAAWPAIPIEEIDWAAVPGLAFDASGNRLGRGVGFYDRFLAAPPSSATVLPTSLDRRSYAAVPGALPTRPLPFRLGVALDEQLVALVPTDVHDIAMQAIVTPSRYLVC